MTIRRRTLRLATLALAVVAVSSCAETVVEVESDDGEVNVDGSFETVPTTTLPIAGSTSELLAEMSAQMSQLSAQIGDAGDEKATLQRIDAIWVIARPDVESTGANRGGAHPSRRRRQGLPAPHRSRRPLHRRRLTDGPAPQQAGTV